MSSADARGLKSPIAAFLGCQLAFSAILVVVVAVKCPIKLLIPLGLGTAVSLLNSIGLLYAWPRILKKKDVALAFGVIVSKFALSVAVVYWLTRPSTRDWFAPVPTEGGPSGVTVQGLSLARLTFESAFESPLAFFALGLGVVLPAAVIAAWVETRANGDTLDSFE